MPENFRVTLTNLDDIQIYELLLQGRILNFPSGFWVSKSTEEAKDVAIKLLKYLIDERLELSKEDVKKDVSKMFLTKYKLRDCPRAEVMMSFRHAQDYTYIAQLLGRMVRTPLARRIAVDAELNDVHLFLPYYDKNTVETVVKALKDGEDAVPTETGTSRELITLKRKVCFANFLWFKSSLFRT